MDSLIQMYAIAAAFAVVGAVLLMRLRLRGNMNPPAAYAHRIAGVMACVFAVMLIVFATVAWRAA